MPLKNLKNIYPQIVKSPSFTEYYLLILKNLFTKYSYEGKFLTIIKILYPRKLVTVQELACYKKEKYTVIHYRVLSSR